ncbi:unnamed protein product [Withania somnifera]
MAMSLEDLLAKEGFNKRMSKTMPRASSGIKGRSGPIYRPQDPNKYVASSGAKKMERIKSDIPWHDLKGKHKMGFCDRSSDVKRISISSFDEFLSACTSQNNEVVEVEERTDSRYNRIYSNRTYRNETREGRSSSRSEEAESKRQSFGKDTQATTKCLNNSSKHISGRPSFRDDYHKHTEKPETSYSRSTRSSLSNKSYYATTSLKKGEIEHIPAIPALDEVAIQAVISILSGHIKCFLLDEDFRTSLRHSSFASLNFVGLEEGLNTESKIIATLEQAIETVERAAEDCTNEKELKKASLQLSVITGLNSDELRDRFTSGIPNSKLAVCAHLYLSVIYKIQKKDRIAARHLLQVFCDSPFQARTSLLPDLWDRMFLPHLSHLKVWYDSEANFLGDQCNKSRKLKLLDKLYHENLDKGTYQFAVYYKDWLTKGAEIPLVPSIQIPSISVLREGSFSNSSHLHGGIGNFSPQPVVSKKLYDEVFRHSHKLGAESEEHQEESYEISVRRPASFAAENLVPLTYSAEVIKCIDQDVASATVDSYGASTAWDAVGVFGADSPEEKNFMGIFGNSNMKETTEVKSNMLDSIAPANLTEFIFNRITKAALEQETEEERVDYEDYVGRPSTNIPPELICPLTGLIFEDPVTFETGQTFERASVANWFLKGNRTCPVTRRSLECQSVPCTNFILKSVITNWKAEHWRLLLACISKVAGNSGGHSWLKNKIAVSLLEQLLIALNQDERKPVLVQLLSLGSLQFLVNRLNTDTNCRNVVAGTVDKMCLVNLLQKEERKDANFFLKGLCKDNIINAMHDLQIYLQDCPREQKIMVAVLLLHFNLLAETDMPNIYRDDVVDSISLALESSISDERSREICCKALLILGGYFSFSGKIMTEDWILKQAGFLEGFGLEYPNEEHNNELVDATVMPCSMTRTHLNGQMEDEEEEAREKWLLNASALLIGNGKKSFVEALSKCLGSGNSEMIRICLTTTAWLTVITQLKECLQHGDLVEHKVLAAMSLLNFSKIQECRVLLMMIAKGFVGPLESLVEVTWTAKELYTIIYCS